MAITMEKYDYDKERPFFNTLFEMQLMINKSTEMRIKRLERVVEDLADIVFADNDEFSDKLFSGTSRYKL